MDSIKSLYDLIEKGREGKNIGLKTGCPKMDKFTGGIQRGIYTLIFGGSGTGKTAYTLYNYIYRPLKDYPDKPFRCIYYSLELSESLLLAKLLCLYIYEEFNYVISYSDLMSWQNPLSDEAYEYVKKGQSGLSSITDKLIIFDKSLNAKSFYKTLSDVLESEGEFEKIQVEYGERTIYKPNNPETTLIVVADHLGLVSPTDGRSKKEEIDLISSRAVHLKELCHIISFVMLMQENRNSADMDRRKADLTECTAEDIKDLIL